MIRNNTEAIRKRPGRELPERKSCGYESTGGTRFEECSPPHRFETTLHYIPPAKPASDDVGFPYCSTAIVVGSRMNFNCSLAFGQGMGYAPGSLQDREDLEVFLTPPPQEGIEEGYWKAQDDIALFHFDDGEGEDVLFLHGGPATSSMSSTSISRSFS